LRNKPFCLGVQRFGGFFQNLVALSARKELCGQGCSSGERFNVILSSSIAPLKVFCLLHENIFQVPRGRWQNGDVFNHLIPPNSMASSKMAPCAGKLRPGAQKPWGVGILLIDELIAFDEQAYVF